LAECRKPRPKGASLNADRTPTGSPAFPIIFGLRRTAVLMYIAVHPGCSARDIMAGTGISFCRWTHARKFLQKLGLLMCGPHEYHIHQRIQCRSWLTRFLRAQGAAHGLEPVRRAFRVVASRRAAKGTLRPLPDLLFYGAKRAPILLTLASVGECYGREAALATGMTEANAIRQLKCLEIEGIVSSRIVGRARLFSLNGEYPGGSDLRTILRSMGRMRPSISAGVSAIMMHRCAIMKSGPARARSVVLEIRRPAKVVWGANFKFAAKAQSRLNVLTRKRKKAA